MRIRPLVLLCLLAFAAPAAAEAVPPGYTYTDEWLQSFDGTQLHAGIFLPSNRTAGERHPIIMVPGPYTSPNGGVATGTASNTSGPVIRFPELFDQKAFKDGRYGYVQLDVRGFGGAGGCYEYYGENEARDVATGTEWASKRDWSTGKIALWGKSYDAADALLGVAERAKGLAAAVIQSPGLSAYTALWMNGVHYATGRYATTATYTADDVGPAQNADYATSPEYAQSNLAPVTSLPSNPTCRADALLGMNTIGDRDDPFWADREPYRKAIGATTPVLWSHGFYDANTKPVHMDVWNGLAGPKYAWFGGYTHVRGHEPGVGRKGFLDQAFRFLDTYVRGVDAGIESDPLVTVQQTDPSAKWRLEQQWPPADAEPWAMPVKAGTYTDQPGNDAYSLPSNGTWSITAPLPSAAHLAGEAKLDVPVTTTAPGAHLTALLYDLDAAGKATFVQRGAFAVEGTGAQRAAFALYPQDYRFATGHRIALLITEGDDDWFSPGVTNTPVEVGAGSLSLPLLRHARTRFVAGGVSDGMASNSFTVPAATIASAAVAGTPPPQD